MGFFWKRNAPSVVLNKLVSGRHEKLKNIRWTPSPFPLANLLSDILIQMYVRELRTVKRLSKEERVGRAMTKKKGDGGLELRWPQQSGFA